MKLHKHYTWSEMVAEAARKPAWTEPHSARTTRETIRFTGSNSYDEAMALLETGWAEGAAKIERGLQGIGATCNAPAFRLDVAGAFPHPGIAASGDPACMFTQGEETRHRPSLILVCGGSYNAGVTAESVFNHGLAVCGIVDAIEAEGTRVELIIERRSTWEGIDYGNSIVIKEMGQPLDVYRIAYCFCHASFLRRIGFRLEELYLPESQWARTYGMPQKPLRDNFPPGSVFIPQPCNATFEQAKARIEAALSEGQNVAV